MILFPRCGRLIRPSVPYRVAAPQAGQAEHRRAELLQGLEVFTDARAERYWQLMGIINGWPPFQPHVPAFEWMIAALRAHPQSAGPRRP